MRRSAFQFSSVSLGFLFAVLLGGCASHPPPHYYTLKPVSVAEHLTGNYSIGIQPVVMPSWLDQNKISWNDGDVNLVILEQDRWADPLSNTVNQIILRNFSRIYPDSFVSLGPWVRSATPDRVVTIRIMTLERASNELSTEIAITISDQKRKVFSNSFRIYRHPLADSSSAAEFAEALGTILGNVNMDIALQLNKD